MKVAILEPLAEKIDPDRKVLQQTSPSGTYKGPLDVAVKVFKNEGPRAFYKGTLTPLLGIGACVSIQFAAFGAAKRYFTKDKAPGQNLSMGELFAAGAFAGVANTILSGPIENIRIKLQGQPKPKAGEQKLYNGPLDVASKLYRAHGIKGIFQGQVPTIWRDGLGSG
jgi:solute carrier family 25 carnitine/acylcarnitine transporter 20/29